MYVCPASTLLIVMLAVNITNGHGVSNEVHCEFLLIRRKVMVYLGV